MHPRVLIVGTVPYNNNSTSRAFDAYFHFWEKENVFQIFSDTKAPCKGHCNELYQITDYDMLQRWLHKVKETGKIYHYEDLKEKWVTNDLEVVNDSVRKAYKIGKTHTPLIYLLRGILWKKKYWCTPNLIKWLDEFNPECVFLSFSESYFIPQIAYFVARRYDIPIVSSIGDDYYFNSYKGISIFYPLYKKLYKNLIDKVLSWKGSAIYISDKIRDKYNKEFNLDGETVYLTSTLERKKFRPIDKKNPYITYFGNIAMGRSDSLCDIATALSEINKTYKIHVFSNEIDEKYYGKLVRHPNVVYGGSIPYENVKKEMIKSDITIIVEGTKKKDIELSRYSLSTKAADALASGCSIITYGSGECGIVEYMESTNASIVCKTKESLRENILNLINDEEMQSCFYMNAIKITKENHNLISSCKVFEDIVKKAMLKGV